MVPVKQDTIYEFEWDKGNIDKSFAKHGITPNEAEEIFLDEDLKVIRDIKHSQKEERYIAVGKNSKEVILSVVFTFRRQKIRIISARIANKKERSLYEKTKKNTTF